MRERKINLKADLLLLSVAIIWGVTFLIVQKEINEIPVYSFLFFRFAVSTFLILILSFKYLKFLDKKTLLYGFILGVSLFAGFAFQTFSLLYAKSSVVAFITGLNVVFVPFLIFFIFKEKIRKNVIFASFLACFGLYFLTMTGNLTFGYGQTLSFICSIMFALQIIFTGIFSKKSNIFLLVLIQLLTVSVLSLIFSLFLEEKTFNINYDYSFFEAIIITSIFATVYAFLVQTFMQKSVSSAKTAVIFTMEPVSAGFMGYFIGNENLSFIQIIGAILVILATLLSEIKLSKISIKDNNK